MSLGRPPTPRSESTACSRCGRPLGPDARACDGCHALVHAAKLETLAAAARTHEEQGEKASARDEWAKALDLLPPESEQAGWIRGRLDALDANSPPSTVTSDAAGTTPGWARRLGPLAPLALLLAKGKFFLALLKLKFLFSLGAFVAFYWALYGPLFGVGFALLVLVHELGHYLALKRRGLPAELPVFLPGFGAYVRWTATGTSLETRALISLAGPLAGCLASAACAAVWEAHGTPLWAGLASVSAMINLLNLIPLWILDGGQAIAALDKTERVAIAVVAGVLAAYLSQPLLLWVAGGALYRVFTKDLPPAPNRTILAYYLIVLSALAYLLRLVPPVAPHA